MTPAATTGRSSKWIRPGTSGWQASHRPATSQSAMRCRNAMAEAQRTDSSRFFRPGSPTSFTGRIVAGQEETSWKGSTPLLTGQSSSPGSRSRMMCRCRPGRCKGRNRLQSERPQCERDGDGLRVNQPRSGLCRRVTGTGSRAEYRSSTPASRGIGPPGLRSQAMSNSADAFLVGAGNLSRRNLRSLFRPAVRPGNTWFAMANAVTVRCPPSVTGDLPVGAPARSTLWRMAADRRFLKGLSAPRPMSIPADSARPAPSNRRDRRLFVRAQMPVDFGG